MKESMPQQGPPSREGLFAYIRSRPILVGLLLAGGVGGAVLAVVLPVAPEEMSLLRRALGGALAGVLFAMCALGFRLFD